MIPQAFPLVALLGFPSIKEKEKGFEPQFNCLHAKRISGIL